MSFTGVSTRSKANTAPSVVDQDSSESASSTAEYIEDDTVNLSLNDPGLDPYLRENQDLFRTRKTSETLDKINMPKAKGKEKNESDEEKSCSSDEEIAEDPVKNAIDKISRKLNRQLQMGGGTGITLEHFDARLHKPSSWFAKFRKFCQFKNMTTKAAIRLFPLAVREDDVAAWIEEIPEDDKADLDALEKAFLAEFGPATVALHDQKAALHSLKQGKDSAKRYIRKVMARIRELYGLPATEELNEQVRQVAQTVLMQGLNSSIRAQLALQGCDELEDIIRVAKLADEANRDSQNDMVGSITERVYEAIHPELEQIAVGVNTINSQTNTAPSQPPRCQPTLGWYQNQPQTSSTPMDNAKPGPRYQPMNSQAPKRVQFQPMGKQESSVPFNGVCYGCNRWGHRVAYCTNRYNSGGGTARSTVICQLCQRSGHTAPQCRQHFMGPAPGNHRQ